MDSQIVSILSLTEQERLQTPGWLSRLKTVHEWLSSAVETVKDNKNFAETLKAAAPWAGAALEATKEVLPPVKFAIKLLDELTKVQEPEALALVACTLAYQSTAVKVLSEIGVAESQRVTSPLQDSVATSLEEFSSFTLPDVVSQPFVHQADRTLEFYARQVGYSPTQIQKIITLIHDRFPDELTSLISNGKSKDKFDPLWRWLQLDPEGRAARAALRRHSEYLKWLFLEAPVLEHEPYALTHIYIDTGCGLLTRSQLDEKGADGKPKRKPFDEDTENGGRQPLLQTVMNLIRDTRFREPIVIQGSAGCGKSSFTLQLSAALREEGLRPIRIRLRDANIEKEFFTALGEAVALEDEIYLRGHNRWPGRKNILQGGAIFRDEIPYREGRICPYVLILDGWDEISVAVNEGFKQRVTELLMNLRRELLGSGPLTRVILTGLFL